MISNVARRQLGIALAMAVSVFTAQGCTIHRPCGKHGDAHHGGHDHGLFILGSSCGDSCNGCGETYVDEWLNEPPGCQKCCGENAIVNDSEYQPHFRGFKSIWGYRCEPLPEGCDLPACRDGGCFLDHHRNGRKFAHSSCASCQGHGGGAIRHGSVMHGGEVIHGDNVIHDGEVIYDGEVIHDGGVMHGGEVIHDGEVIYEGPVSARSGAAPSRVVPAPSNRQRHGQSVLTTPQSAYTNPPMAHPLDQAKSMRQSQSSTKLTPLADSVQGSGRQVTAAPNKGTVATPAKKIFKPKGATIEATPASRSRQVAPPPLRS